MALPDITHIFQIPLGWLRAVDNRVFKSAPGNLIEFNENDEGGVTIGVDQEDFENAVKQVVGTTPSGETATFNVVTSVTWSSPNLVVKTRQLTYTDGVLTAIGTEQTTDIGTVAYSS